MTNDPLCPHTRFQQCANLRWHIREVLSRHHSRLERINFNQAPVHKGEINDQINGDGQQFAFPRSRWASPNKEFPLGRLHGRSAGPCRLTVGIDAELDCL